MSRRTESEGIEVNGKIDLGTRKLKVLHVENACSFFACQQPELSKLAEVKRLCQEQILDQPALKKTPAGGQMVGVYDPNEKRWMRGMVDDFPNNQSGDKNQIRVRMVDFGWSKTYNVSKLRELPQALADAKIYCEKYRLAGLKPRGKEEGYSFEDRLIGAAWLKSMVKKNLVMANCHKLVKYAGGIMADCMVGDVDLNRAALRQGHAFVNPHNLLQAAGDMSMAAVGMPKMPPTGMMSMSSQVDSMSSISNGGGRVNSSRGGGGGGDFQHDVTFHPSGSMDVDYCRYNDNMISYPLPMRQPFLSSSAPMKKDVSLKNKEVKKLEKKLKEDKQKIEKLKKATNLDAGVKDLVRLGNQVGAARRKAAAAENGQPENPILAALIGVPEVLESCLHAVEQFTAYDLAVTKAENRLLEEQTKQKLRLTDDGQMDLSTFENKLTEYINKYLQVCQEVSTDDLIARVSNQLWSISPHVASSNKIMGSIADSFTKEYTLASVKDIQAWIADHRQSPAATTTTKEDDALSAKSRKEIAAFCASLNELSTGLMSLLNESSSTEGGGKSRSPKVPHNLDAQLEAAKAALQNELTSRRKTAPMSSSSTAANDSTQPGAAAGKKDKKAGTSPGGNENDKDDKSVVLLNKAWQCLTFYKIKLKMFVEQEADMKNRVSMLINEPDSAASSKEAGQEPANVSAEIADSA